MAKGPLLSAVTMVLNSYHVLIWRWHFMGRAPKRRYMAGVAFDCGRCCKYLMFFLCYAVIFPSLQPINILKIGNN